MPSTSEPTFPIEPMFPPFDKWLAMSGPKRVQHVLSVTFCVLVAQNLIMLTITLGAHIYVAGIERAYVDGRDKDPILMVELRSSQLAISKFAAYYRGHLWKNVVAIVILITLDFENVWRKVEAFDQVLRGSLGALKLKLWNGKEFEQADEAEVDGQQVEPKKRLGSRLRRAWTM
ncbi:hypothetical protein NLJ89_g3179 [Agrocybe chaxingu]|uniref:Uncharacterized protein n=1 Tax=Agrocybe chaxingu TaxID=84603 RepID=A0A9W8KBE6_9AGAR|nr:hypothetical protein NLJ89_g3179 [Agrocybe chaxingu]